MARVSNTNSEMYRGLAFKGCGLGLESLVHRARGQTLFVFDGVLPLKYGIIQKSGIGDRCCAAICYNNGTIYL